MTTKRLDLYLTHRRALIDQATRIVGDPARAEDVVQDAWLRFEDASRHPPPIERPKSYLFQVVRNLAIDLKRRMAWEVQGEEAETVFAAAPESAPSQERRAIDRNELDCVVAALAELPERSRRALHMHRFDGKTYKEIGGALGISEALAHRIVGKAVAHCLRRMADGPS